MILYHYILIGFLDFDCSQWIYQSKPATWTPKRCPRSSLQTCPRRRCYRSNDDGMGWCPRWIFSETMMWYEMVFQSNDHDTNNASFLSVSQPIWVIASCIVSCSRSSVFWFRGWNSLWTWPLSSGFFFPSSCTEAMGVSGTGRMMKYPPKKHPEQWFLLITLSEGHRYRLTAATRWEARRWPDSTGIADSLRRCAGFFHKVCITGLPTWWTIITYPDYRSSSNPYLPKRYTRVGCSKEPAKRLFAWHIRNKYDEECTAEDVMTG